MNFTSTEQLLGIDYFKVTAVTPFSNWDDETYLIIIQHPSKQIAVQVICSSTQEFITCQNLWSTQTNTIRNQISLWHVMLQIMSIKISFKVWRVVEKLTKIILLISMNSSNMFPKVFMESEGFLTFPTFKRFFHCGRKYVVLILFQF